MEIIENFIFGKKGSSVDCEDGLVITDSIIAVVDGATSKTQKKFDNLASGAFARKTLCNILRQPDIEKLNSEELFSKLTSGLKENSEKFHKDLSFEEYPRACIIIYNNLYKEIWSYGDCQCIINGELHTHETAIDALNSQLRAFYLECALLEGHNIEELSKCDIGRMGIYDNLKKQYMFENKDVPFGFSVLNGEPINPNMIVRYKIKENDEIVLSSDGYPFLKDTLQESEEQLENVLKNDPMCFSIYKATKGIVDGNYSFDDRCYCKFIV